MDQYLHFRSHHAKHQKPGVIRTLINRCESIISEESDKEEERDHIKQALRACGYPDWAFKKDLRKVQKRNPSKKKNKNSQKKGLVVIPYVEGISERIERTLKKYNVSTAMRPQSTLRNILVHPKDKCSPEEQGEIIYKIPCKNCHKSYIGETGRLFKTRLEEHKADVANSSTSQFTRSQRKLSQNTIHKSALTDHANRENHEIDWDNAKVIDRESQKRRRHIKEAIWIKRTEGAINRDEGNYQLSHLYQTVIHHGIHLY